MGLKKLRVQAKAKPARGAQDAAVCVELMSTNWEEIQDAYNACTEEEKNDLKDHFNNAVEGQGIGFVLFGDEEEEISAEKDDFAAKIEALNEKEEKQFVEALKESELISDFPSEG